MKLCTRQEIFKTFSFKEHPWNYFRALGFECVDYTLEGNEIKENLLKIKKEINDAGLYAHQVHGPWKYPPHDETSESRAATLDNMKNSICLTAMLGAKFWVIHPFFPFGQTSVQPEETLDINEECFRKLLPVAKEYGITICLENMPFKDFVLSSPENTLSFIHRINDESFKFCLDTGHSNVLGTPPAEAVRMAGSDLRALHIHDNNADDDSHRMPYTGNINWNDFMKSLKEVNYKGALSFEVTSKYPLGEDFFVSSDEERLSLFKTTINRLCFEK